jgi:selenocysteine lyase/cysteine desulfurase
VGLSASEVQRLAGLKEGCGDDLDFITVQRPAGTSSGNSSNTPAAAVAAAVATPMSASLATTDVTGDARSSNAAVQQQQQQPPLVEVQVPLGSVRASLGWASTFEDAYALVQFLKGYLQ